MAASLTLGACSLAADGKTLTATISGGSGSGYAISSVAGLIPHFSGNAPYQKWGFVVSAASVAGTTLTLVLATSVGIGETLQLDITAASTLTDDGANTPTGQANLAVTNNSAVTVRILDPVTDKASFEYNGQFVTVPFRKSDRKANEIDNFDVELVTDATEIAVLTLQTSNTQVALDGAAAGAAAGNPDGFWVAKPLAAGLSAGRHLLLLAFDDYFYGIRLVGGTRATYTVPTAKQTLRPNTGLVDKPANPDVTLSGAWKVQVASKGDIATEAFTSLAVEFGFVGTEVEIDSVASPNTVWAASIDGGYEGALIRAGDAAVNGQNSFVTLAKGLANAVHTIRAMQVGAGVNTTHRMVKVLVGAVATGALAIGDTSITVNDATNLAVDDWVKIDDYGSREWRQVTAKAGNTLTVAALAKAHAAGARVTSYSAPAGSISAWVSRVTTRKASAIGDSNTQGANDNGFAFTPDANGVFYNTLDTRRAAIWLAIKDLDVDLLNFGIQGTTSTNQTTQTTAAAGPYKPAGGYEFVTIETGTNDINGTTTTPAQYQANVQALVTAMKPALEQGGRVILLPPATPAGVTNSGGLNVATCRAALTAIAAADPATVIYDPDYTLTLVAADLNEVHFHDSGITKRAQQAQRVVTGGPKGFLVA